MAERQTRKALSKQPQSHPLEESATDQQQPAAPAGGGTEHGPSNGDDVLVQLSFRVPASIRHRLKMHAAKVDRAQQDIIAEALNGYLSRHGD